MGRRPIRVLASAEGADIVVQDSPWRPDKTSAEYKAHVHSLGGLAPKRAGQRIVLLLHGWSVRSEELTKNYRPLLQKIHDLAPMALGEMRTISWPARGQYWEVLPTTELIAKALADRLSGDAPFHNARELVLVAHSMGCRVALELVRALNERGFKPEIRLFLVAAAAAVSAVQGAGRLASAARSAVHSSVYYSHVDEVLGPVFQVGQALAGEGGWRVEAIGLRGRPSQGLWSRRVSSLSRHIPYFRSTRLIKDLIEDHKGAREWRSKTWKPVNL